jgi:hypothetical protein
MGFWQWIRRQRQGTTGSTGIRWVRVNWFVKIIKVSVKNFMADLFFLKNHVTILVYKKNVDQYNVFEIPVHEFILDVGKFKAYNPLSIAQLF